MMISLVDEGDANCSSSEAMSDFKTSKARAHNDDVMVLKLSIASTSVRHYHAG